MRSKPCSAARRASSACSRANTSRTTSCSRPRRWMRRARRSTSPLQVRTLPGPFVWKRSYRISDGDVAYALELASVVTLGVIEGRWKVARTQGIGDGGGMSGWRDPAARSSSRSVLEPRRNGTTCAASFSIFRASMMFASAPCRRELPAFRCAIRAAASPRRRSLRTRPEHDERQRALAGQKRLLAACRRGRGRPRSGSNRLS